MSADDGALTGSLTQRLHAVYSALPAGERRVADLVLDSPGDMALWAASELSERAGVSNATVSRLFRRLEYGTYDEARRASRAMRASGSPLYLTHSEQHETARSSRIGEILAAEKSALETSLSLVNPLTLDEAGLAIAKARRVHLGGFRNSHFVATYGQSMLAQFRPDVQALLASGQTLAESLSNIEAGDVAIIVGLRRRPKVFNSFMTALAKTGAMVVLIADRSIREAPALARWTFTCGVETPQALDCYAGALAVVRAITLETAGHLGPAGRKHLNRVESFHEVFEELE